MFRLHFACYCTYFSFFNLVTVVYEHRSRLERSLQKERSEHKKTKEDFLVYKLEAQEALNKEKQDSMNRYGSLSSQHKILKNQHEEVKKQFLDLQLQHNGLKLEHRKALETHNQKYSQLQREKNNEVVGLQDTVFKLREESKLLRKAHQDVHSQLLNAQVQMEEFRKLKETLQKMPSFKDAGTAKEQRYGQPLGSNVLQFARPKASKGDGIKEPPRSQDKAGVPAGNSFAIPPPGIKRQGEENVVHENRVSHNNNIAGAQRDVPFGQLAPPKEVNLAFAAQPPARHKEAPMIRYTRMMNSVQNQDPEAGENLQGQQGHPEEFEPRLNFPAASEEGRVLEEKLSNKQDQRVQSWQEIVNKGNSQMNDGRVLPYQDRTDGSQVKMETGRLRHTLWGAEKGGTDERDLHADAGMTKKENHTYLQKEAIIPKQMGPKDVADPAQDPNNQGEDEFEEAELERPSFEEKTDPDEQTPQTNRPAKAVSKEKIPKGADRSNKATDNLMDGYQEDQEQDPEDHGGEVAEPKHLQQFHQAKGHIGDVDKKKEYF
uniref:Golgi integral membrane protein 4 n=1 Tax=Laticauda laticaudata TaxID=8630 RepID=A0A8C5SFW9_LATLA